MSTGGDLDALKRQMMAVMRLTSQMQRDMERRPLRSSSAGAQNKILKIIDGNLVNPALTYYGINKEFSELTSVPVAYDPNAYSTTPGDFTAIDGIGRAYLIINGVLQDDLVLVCHDTRAGALIQNIQVQDDYCQTWNTVSLLVGAGPDTVTAYIPEPL